MEKLVQKVETSNRSSTGRFIYLFNKLYMVVRGNVIDEKVSFSNGELEID